MSVISGAKLGIRQLIGTAAQSTAVRELAFRASGSALRTLAFHGVPDLDHFAELTDLITRRYRPVTAEDVADAIAGLRPLPKHAVWFTFDDGLASTFAAGAMLAERDIQGTVFICPSAVGSNSLLWFQVLEEAQQRGLIAATETSRFTPTRLKSLPDPQLRDEIAVLSDRLGTVPPTVDRSPAIAVLQEWVAQGHELGNHTWDHPCMDQCSPEEQRRQITLAHNWLVEHGFPPRFFAYPNGNWSELSAKVADDLGYVGSVLFDHNLTRHTENPHRISRLRIDSYASTRRALSILSGAHSTLFHAGRGPS